MEPNSKLPGVTLKRFHEALLAAFPTRNDLAQMVRVGLDENLEAIAAPENLRITVFQLLGWAEAQGRLPALISGARRENPGNPALRAFAEEYAGERVPTPFHVPFLPNPAFVGRDDDLEALHRFLHDARSAGVRPAALTGMGGIGKTQLAVEYAYRHRDAYPGGVYWVNAAEPWQAELARLAVEVGLDAASAFESERRMRLALAFAKHLRERPDALVIFDNVEDPLALRSPGAGFIPEQLGCRLLFTTRRRNIPSGFVGVEVCVLPPGAAVELLLSTDARRHLLAATGTEDDRAEATAICRTLGHLPLAVALAAAFLDQNLEIALGDYRGRLVREGALATVDEGEVDPKELPTRHDAAVGATLQVQWQALEGTARSNQDARLLLMAAAVLGEAAQVPRARLGLLTGLRDRAEDGHPARLVSGLQVLHRLSLIEDLTEKEVRLHPLVREFAEQRIVGREAFAAACAERLGEALKEMGRLDDEVAGRGIDAVLEDLRIGNKLAGAFRQARLEALSRPLDRESHALRGWDRAKEPGFMLQQLHNRSFEMGIEDVPVRAQVKLEEQGWPWLRERIRTSRESEALVRTLEGHTSDVQGVAVTADGRLAVSASEDMTLKVWDLGTGQAIRTLEGHTSDVQGVAVTADGRIAVSASRDNALKVWDLRTGEVIRTLRGHSPLAVTADGRFAVSASSAYSSDNALTVWDLGTGLPLHTLERHHDYSGVAVTADGRFAVSASGNKMLKVWDLRTGQPVQSIEMHVAGDGDLAVTADGHFAVSASIDRTLNVWDLYAGRLVSTLEGMVDGIGGVAVAANGHLAVFASSGESASNPYDNVLKVWDLRTGQAVRTLETQTALARGVAVTADGRFAISASYNNTLKVWDLGTRQVVRALDAHTSDVSGVAVTANNRFAVSASYDGTLKVWDLSTGQAIRTLVGHTSGVTGVAVTAGDHFAISASLDQTLKVWDLGTGQAVRTLVGHSSGVTGVAVTAGDHFAISASLDQTLKVWDLGTGQAVRTLVGHAGGVSGVVVIPNSRFAVSTSHDNTLKVWDLDTGQAVRTLDGQNVRMTADGRFAFSASTEGMLTVRDIYTGWVCTLDGHTSRATSVMVTADGRFAVSASSNGTLKVWNLGKGQPVTTLKIHASLTCCTITPDTKTILTGDETGGLHILDWQNSDSAS